MGYESCQPAGWRLREPKGGPPNRRTKLDYAKLNLNKCRIGTSVSGGAPMK
jgi:hypothetical protein